MSLDKPKIARICDNIIFFSICVIAFFLPISKAVIESFSILAIIAYLARKFIAYDGFPKTRLNWGIYGYVLVCLVSIFISTEPKISARTFFAKTLQDIFFFFAAAEALAKGKRLKIVLYVLFASSLLLGIDGIYQYFTRVDFLRFRPRIFEDRIYASFATPNSFGCYLAMVLPFLLALGFFKFRLKAVKTVYFGLFALLFTCLLLTVSRGAWFAFVSTALFMAVWLRPLSLFFLIMGIIVLISQPFYPSFIRDRLNNFMIFSDVSSMDRRIIWQAGWRMFLSCPWFGVGLGAFMGNFRKFAVNGYQYGVPYAHNCYLQMASELGVLGLSVFLSILGLFFYHGIKSLNAKERNFSWYVLLASQAAILGFCVQMGVDTILYSLDLGMLFWLVLAIGCASMSNRAIGGHNTNCFDADR